MFTNNLQQVSDILQNGGVAIFPTDTVWGLGCSIERTDAISKFYQIKKRELDKPTAVLVGSIEQAKRYGILNEQALSLAKAYWPGALTVIVKATDQVPQAILGENKTIGIRIPNFEIVQQLATQLSCGLVTGSANFSGGQSPLSKDQLDSELLKLVDVVLDGECGGQPPSTIVDCTKDTLKVIRQGQIQINLK